MTRIKNRINMGWQLAPATTFTKQKLSFSTLNIKQPGYLFVYLSYDNDSNNWVYFDDFKITHTPTNVLQYNEYYPFGLQTENSWTREGSNNAFLYNAGSEMNENSGWYETFYRDYDPIQGRFNQVDPLANASSSLTPYGYGFNDPVFYDDPMGYYPPGTCCTYGGGGMGSGGGWETDLYGNPIDSYGNRISEHSTYRIGPGSGHHWSDQFSSSSYMSAGDFINSALNSQCISPLINCTNSEKQICTTKLGKDDKNKTSIFTRRPVEPSSGGRKGGIFRDLPQAQFITCLTF